MNIAILSKGPGNYSTKRLVEEARKRGHSVSVINYAKCYVALESGRPVVNYKGEELTNFDVIIPRIASALLNTVLLLSVNLKCKTSLQLLARSLLSAQETS